MKSIICNPFYASKYDVSPIETALDRLGEYIDLEQETLGRVLAQCNRRQAAASLDRVGQLHLESICGADGLRELLEEAQVALELIFETLHNVSYNQSTVSAWGLPGPASFDVHLRWSAARLQDIISTLQWALND